MRKYNKYDLAMRMKYGNDYDAPLFHSKPTESAQPPSTVPVIINDATEEKAAVYDSVVKKKETEIQREAVLVAIRHLPEPTDNDIARFLKIVPSTVAARRNELRDMGLVLPVLDEYGKKRKKIDPITKTPNTIWRATQ